MQGFHALVWLLAGMALVSIAYQLVVVVTLLRYFAAPRPGGPVAARPVSLLKPLHGDEPRLADNLAGFLAQDYAAPVQMVCGVNAPGDAAVAAVAALRGRFPAADIALSQHAVAAASNRKIGNVMAMAPLAAHDILILSDSDMVVGPDYCARVNQALAAPGVGVVSCLYIARGDAGAWSRLGAASVSYAMMPNMVLALAYGLSQPCMGSTIAMRRETLDAIGGFGRFADELADDYAIGQAVTGLGLSVAVPPMLITHAGDEDSLAALWRHHLRWMVTLRGIVGWAHVGTVIGHALPLTLLAALALVGVTPVAGGVLVAAALTVRYAAKRSVDRLSGVKTAPFLWLCAGDCLEFAVFLASLSARRIDWRGETLTMARDGRIATPEMEPR